MVRRPGLTAAVAGLIAATFLKVGPVRAQDRDPSDRDASDAATFSPGPPPPRCPCVGPSRGSVLIAGGELSPKIYQSFVRLADGAKARIVVIPTAGREDHFPPDWPGLEPFRQTPVRSLHLLHTRDRSVANDEKFVAPLREATGVWLLGGRQFRLAEAYLGTRVHEELRSVLDRGGVVGGTSAGASVLASYLMRGTLDGSERVSEPGNDVGFGLLRGVAIDQHLIARNRENELLRVIQHYPHLLGIGLDEGTAVVIRGDLARVEGESRVGIYDQGGWNRPVPFRWLEQGETYDLYRRLWIDRLP